MERAPGEPQGRANIRAFALLDCVKLLPSAGWAIMSVVAFPAYFGMGWYTPAILSVVSTLLSAGFAYEVVTYQRRFKYVVAGKRKSECQERERRERQRETTISTCSRESNHFLLHLAASCLLCVCHRRLTLAHAAACQLL
jgi:hypothetical protein